MAFKKWCVRDLETLGDGKFVSLGVREHGCSGDDGEFVSLRVRELGSSGDREFVRFRVKGIGSS